MPGPSEAVASTKILIVEDEVISAKDLARSLERLGYEVAGRAASAEQVFRILEQSTPDLILMDIKLKGPMDGIEAAERIRNEFDIPVVFITAFTEKNILDRAKRTEPYGYLGKPVSPPELRLSIETALYKHEMDMRIRDSERLYHTLLDTMAEGIILQDNQYVIQSYNSAAERILGIALDQIVGKSSFDVEWYSIREDGSPYPVADHPSTVTLQTAESFSRAIMGIVQQDGVVWISINTRPLFRDGEKLPYAVVTSFSDVTELKQAEQALKHAHDHLESRLTERTAELKEANEQLRIGICKVSESEKALKISEERLELALQGANLGLWDWNIQTGVDIRSPRWAAILGYAPEEIGDTVDDWLDRLHPDDRKRVLSERDAHLKGRTPFYVSEYRLQMKSGDWKWIHSRGAVVERDANGKPLRMSGTILDIHDRKVAQEELAKAHRELEERVAERTADLTRITNDLHMEVQERKRAMEVLLINEARLREAEKVGKIGNWEWDFLTNQTSWSAGIHRILDVPPGELAPDYESFVKLTPPEDRKEVWQTIQKCISNKEQFEYEHRVVTLKGDVKTLWVRGYVKVDAEGNPTGMRGIAQDITDRKRAEEALRNSEALLKEAQRVAHIGHWELDRMADTPTWSEEIFHIFGLDPTQGEPRYGVLLDLIYPEDRDLLNRSLKALRADGVPYDIEFRVIRVDKSIRWMNAKGYPGRNNKGQIVRLFGTAQDITDRKRAEEELQRNEATLRAILQAAPIGIGQVFEGRKLGWINEKMTEMTGRRPADVLGKSARIFYENDEAFQHVENVKMPQIRATGTGSVETRFLHTDGTVRDILLTSHVVDSNDQSKGNVFTAVDMTDRKNEERQRALLERRLRESQKMEAVGTLAGGIAHDFNNLLQIISGHAELMETELAQGSKKFPEIDAIRHAADRGADLVRQILTFSRRVDSEFELINLNDDVKNVERLLYRTIPKMIEIELNLATKLRPVRADASQIDQLLINLAVNAKDAMPEGGRLTIETRNVKIVGDQEGFDGEPISGDYALLRVSDTGHGMDEEVLQHLYEPFFTTKGLAHGTGLGLATVFGIVKMHGGYIKCDSEVGKGTTFSIYLPAVAEAETDADEDCGAAESAGGSEIILVVDDEPLIAGLAKRLLEKSGYSVITASSGSEALQIYSELQSRIALVILDLIMPEMSGAQCLEELSKINPQVKTLIASGFAVQGDSSTFAETHAKGKVSKPFNRRELLRSVRRVLDGL